MLLDKLHYVLLVPLSCTTPMILKISINICNEMFGTNLDVPLINRLTSDRVAYYPLPKKPSEYLAHNSQIMVGSDYNKTELRKEIISVFEYLENHDLFKYLMYVNAVQSVDRPFFDTKYSTMIGLRRGIYFYDDASLFGESIRHRLKIREESLGFYLDSSKSIHIYIDKQIWNSKKSLGSELESKQYKNLGDKYEVLAHELSHDVFQALYNNDCKPFSRSNTSTEFEYNNLLQRANDSYIMSHIREFYVESEYGSEFIAYYLGRLANPYADNLKSQFFEFGEFYKKYSIPDMIEYVRNHRNCNKVEFDGSIECAGEVASSNTDV